MIAHVRDNVLRQFVAAHKPACLTAWAVVWTLLVVAVR